MHCTSQSLLRGAFSAAFRQPTSTPPSFLVPALLKQAAPFSTTSILEQRGRKRDRNPDRGISALKRGHGGVKALKRRGLYAEPEELPKPVLDPELHSAIDVDPNHGLWGFFTADKEVLQTPIAVNNHGRAWAVAELRLRDWDDLHRLWWVCVKEMNRIRTMEAERKRLKAGYGEYEAEERMKVVQTTMKRIKFVLTERWYAWEEARWDAMADPSVDMYAEDGQNAYDASKDVAEIEDAFEQAEQTPQPSSEAPATSYVPPGSPSPAGGREFRV